jgi:hypothetical protein
MNHAPLATLRFFAENLRPDEIAKIISEKPSASVAMGDIQFRRNDRATRARTGMWFISTKDRHLGRRPDTHLAWVVKLALEHLQAIRREVPSIQVDLSLLVHDPKFTLADLPQDLLRHAVELGELEIEVPAKGEDIFLNTSNLADHLTTARPGAT